MGVFRAAQMVDIHRTVDPYVGVPAVLHVASLKRYQVYLSLACVAATVVSLKRYQVYLSLAFVTTTVVSLKRYQVYLSLAFVDYHCSIPEKIPSFVCPQLWWTTTVTGTYRFGASSYLKLDDVITTLRSSNLRGKAGSLTLNAPVALPPVDEVSEK